MANFPLPQYQMLTVIPFSPCVMVKECLLPSLIQACWNLLKMCDSCTSWPAPAFMYKSWTWFRTEVLLGKEVKGGGLVLWCLFLFLFATFFSCCCCCCESRGSNQKTLKPRRRLEMFRVRGLETRLSEIQVISKQVHSNTSNYCSSVVPRVPPLRLTCPDIFGVSIPVQTIHSVSVQDGGQVNWTTLNGQMNVCNLKFPISFQHCLESVNFLDVFARFRVGCCQLLLVFGVVLHNLPTRT